LKLIDTNVFIYAAGRPHEYKQACVRVLDLLVTSELDGKIDTEVIQEVMYVFWNRKEWDKAISMTDRLIRGFASPFAITLDTIRRARDVFAVSPAIGPRDAIHAAVVLEHGLEGIISTDRGFDAIPGITRFDPKDF
jgi:predicted nucleic acid-binding protein